MRQSDPCLAHHGAHTAVLLPVPGHRSEIEGVEGEGYVPAVGGAQYTTERGRLVAPPVREHRGRAAGRLALGPPYGSGPHHAVGEERRGDLSRGGGRIEAFVGRQHV